MGLWGKFLARRKLEGIYREAKNQTDKELKPLGGIAVAIMQAATNSRDKTKRWINTGDPNDVLKREIYIFYEYMYLFMHLTMREGFAICSEVELKRVQAYLVAVIPPTAIDCYCQHWPENIKAGMKSEFIDKLNDAEVEYTDVLRDKVPSDDKPFLLEIFCLLGIHVSDMCGRKDNLECQQNIALIAAEEFTKMGLIPLLTDVKKSHN